MLWVQKIKPGRDCDGRVQTCIGIQSKEPQGLVAMCQKARAVMSGSDEVRQGVGCIRLGCGSCCVWLVGEMGCRVGETRAWNFPPLNEYMYTQVLRTKFVLCLCLIIPGRSETMRMMWPTGAMTTATQIALNGSR
jgi:hypothetical protein